ncbi:hypothetical protein Exig_1122 [Exiguobacterium sibiricum 255-15]|uniref:Uncharacterized protein n=1 Tax=Exiguobacterium sibiricum (strain DSM 17290 / CCUG 55495 / CIP 109462 / JCM 13490 / 255-15) TaxID=262543 RepID=B1YE99_EXIS2|nr:DUF2188 domain-containing protein [Exiguobacterium sibiricum]ACB60601.1 hypothetical protein Exig_1122 [Exiguobacterium sibiricum 255-15]
MANQHITPYPDGGYQVIEEGASKATERFSTRRFVKLSATLLP